MQNFSANPLEILKSLERNKGLLANLVRREVVGRYQGSMLGIFWSLVTPMLMLLVYTFVFSVVFKARWGAGSGSKTEFALVLFSGLIVFNLFSECITRAPTLIIANANYVKKVIFPLEILPWASLGGAIFHFAVSFTVWVLAYLILVGVPHWTILLAPLVIAPFCLFVMGLSWVLAAFGVFVRDVGQLIGIGVQFLLFLSPIFYPASILPPKLQTLMYFNPISIPVEMMRDVMYWGDLPGFEMWCWSALVSVAISTLGFALFQKTRKGFADVL